MVGCDVMSPSHESKQLFKLTSCMLLYVIPSYSQEKLLMNFVWFFMR